MMEHNQQWENISALMDEEISSDDEMCQVINLVVSRPSLSTEMAGLSPYWYVDG